jgi:hypothetical protein
MSYQPPDWVGAFQQALLDLDEKVTECSKANLTPEEACSLLLELNRCKADFGLIYDGLSSIVSEIMASESEILLDDGAKVEKRWSNQRTGWQHKDLASVVAQKIMNMAVDMDTGEVVMSQQEMIENVLNYVQPSYWRIKELQNIGINPDNYCQVGETKTSIIVRKAQSK